MQQKKKFASLRQMSYIAMTKCILMTLRKKVQKKVGVIKKMSSKAFNSKFAIPSRVEDIVIDYKPSPLRSVLFSVSKGGQKTDYNIHTGYGYYISSFRKTTNLFKVSKTLEEGLPFKELEPMFQFLGFKSNDIAKAASVSARTVLRWNSQTKIKSQSLTNFFKIDELIRKGVELFGNEIEFKKWLTSPNLSMGNVIPSELITTPLGIELVEDAIEALNYGTVM